MLTNPLTIGFWLWLAYQLGALVLGEPLALAIASGDAAPSWLAEFGWPTVLGMGIFSIGGAALGYAAVNLIWHLRIRMKRYTRRGVQQVGR